MTSGLSRWGAYGVFFEREAEVVHGPENRRAMELDPPETPSKASGEVVGADERIPFELAPEPREVLLFEQRPPAWRLVGLESTSLADSPDQALDGGDGDAETLRNLRVAPFAGETCRDDALT